MTSLLPRRVLLVRLPLFVLAGCSLVGCDLVGSGESYDLDLAVEELFPMDVGHRWAYRQWYLDPSLADSFVVEITGRVTFEHDGTTQTAYAESCSANGAERRPWRWLYGYGRDGLYLMGGLAPTDTMRAKYLARR